MLNPLPYFFHDGFIFRWSSITKVVVLGDLARELGQRGRSRYGEAEQRRLFVFFYVLITSVLRWGVLWKIGRVGSGDTLGIHDVKHLPIVANTDVAGIVPGRHQANDRG